MSDQADPEGELTADEFARRLESTVSDEEHTEMVELIGWFSRRYPTPKARLDYVRRKYGEWTRHRGTKARTAP